MWIVDILKEKLWNRDDTDLEIELIRPGSDIPKFMYQHFHKEYKLVVTNLYNRIEEDLVLYRAVSDNPNGADFEPYINDIIFGEEQPSKLEIDKHSLSFYNTIEACEEMAKNVYVRKLTTISIEDAEHWKQTHSHVIQVILKGTDGYVDDFDANGHINFAPFKLFDYTKSMRRNIMNRIDYQDAVKVGVLQGDEGGEYIVLYRDAHARFCIKVIENGAEVYIIHGVRLNDLAKYIKGLIPLSKLGKKYQIEIRDIPMYRYYKNEYAVDKERIIKEMKKINTRDYQSIGEILELKLILGF